MLDVHPPHHAAHSWRDFFIHIATIVVGLLIAVALEQGVEAVHNRHLRQELQTQLRSETEGNKGYVGGDIGLAEACFDWANEQALRVHAAGDGQTVLLRRMRAFSILFPDTGVWLAAKDNGRTALLTVEEQVWFADLYRMEQRSFAPGIGAHDRLQAALSALDKALRPLVVPGGGAFALRPLSADERKELGGQFQSVQQAARDLERELLLYDSALRFVGSIGREHLFDGDLNREYLGARLKNYADHPRSLYTFTAP